MRTAEQMRRFLWKRREKGCGRHETGKEQLEKVCFINALIL